MDKQEPTSAAEGERCKHGYLIAGYQCADCEKERAENKGQVDTMQKILHPPPTTEKVELEVSQKHVICARHGELFRDRWPTGYAIFVTIGLECLFVQPGIDGKIKSIVENPANKLGGTRNSKADMLAVQILLDKKPLCCQLQPRDLYDVLIEVNQKTNTWDTAKCALCNRRGPGAKYRKAPPTLQALAPAGFHDHVCLACACGVQVVGMPGRASGPRRSKFIR